MGGRDAEPGSWPWQLSILFDRNSDINQPGGSMTPRFTHTCGAVLLSETWAMTAAHCVFGDGLVYIFFLILELLSALLCVHASTFTMYRYIHADIHVQINLG